MRAHYSCQWLYCGACWDRAPELGAGGGNGRSMQGLFHVSRAGLLLADSSQQQAGCVIRQSYLSPGASRGKSLAH